MLDCLDILPLMGGFGLVPPLGEGMPGAQLLAAQHAAALAGVPWRSTEPC